MDWNDLKLFLSIADAGSLSAAARATGTSQPTMSRRLMSLEDDLAAPLFTRATTGLTLTALGEKVAEHARHMRDEVHVMDRLITGEDPALEGTVIISAVDAIGSDWLVRELLPFRQRFPGIQLDVRVENSAADLMRGEADIAMRMFRPTQPDLIARKIGLLTYEYFASKDYLARRGRPASMQDLSSHDMVLPHKLLLDFVRTAHEHKRLRVGTPAIRSNSMQALLTATRAGYGIGAHSCLLGIGAPELVRLFPHETIAEQDFWLVTHPDLHRSARIRAAFDFMSDLLTRNRALFSGAVD